VTILTPANDATYEQDAEVLADYTCSDETAGVDNCSGPVAVGGAIDTSTVGGQSFAVTATDLAGNTSTLTHAYTVEAGVVPVDAIDDAASTLEDQPVPIAVLANDTGGNGPLLISAVTQSANGTVTIAGLTVEYTPNANYFGIDTFTYTASDGTTSDTATVAVTVEPVNDAPIAIADEATTDQKSRSISMFLPTMSTSTVRLSASRTSRTERVAPSRPTARS
jgi:hypothetical protein